MLLLENLEYSERYKKNKNQSYHTEVTSKNILIFGIFSTLPEIHRAHSAFSVSWLFSAILSALSPTPAVEIISVIKVASNCTSSRKHPRPLTSPPKPEVNSSLSLDLTNAKLDMLGFCFCLFLFWYFSFLWMPWGWGFNFGLLHVCPLSSWRLRLWCTYTHRHTHSVVQTLHLRSVLFPLLTSLSSDFQTK